MDLDDFNSPVKVLEGTGGYFISLAWNAVFLRGGGALVGIALLSRWCGSLNWFVGFFNLFCVTKVFTFLMGRPRREQIDEGYDCVGVSKW